MKLFCQRIELSQFHCFFHSVVHPLSIIVHEYVGYPYVGILHDGSNFARFQVVNVDF